MGQISHRRERRMPPTEQLEFEMPDDWLQRVTIAGG